MRFTLSPFHLSLLFLPSRCILRYRKGAAPWCNKKVKITDDPPLLDVLSPSYDFIIVGTGAAGSLLAHKLSTNTAYNYRVLVLEGGAFGTGQRDLGGYDYVATAFENDSTGKRVLAEPWTRYDVPTLDDTIRPASDELNNAWPIVASPPFFKQAKIIGGNKAANGMNWIFPQKRNLDAWGIPEYNSTNFWKYLTQIENTTEVIGAGSERGKTGLINIRGPTFISRTQQNFINASLEYGLVNKSDFNSGTVEEGIYIGQSNIRNGRRDSASVAYLKAALDTARNLDVRSSCTVTKIVYRNFLLLTPLPIWKNCTGVEYVAKDGTTRQVFATKEVLLAAGDLQVTKILYHSGVGPASVLKAFGITPTVHNEKVGQVTRNHQRVLMNYEDLKIENPTFYAWGTYGLTWARQGTGIMESRAGPFITLKLSPTSPYPEIQATSIIVFGDNPNSPYSKNFTVTVFLNDNLYHSGSLNLTSPDPLAPTNFTNNIFLEDDDVTTLARGVLKIRDLMTKYPNPVSELAPGPSRTSIESIKTWIRQNPSTTCHYYGSAPMGGEGFPVDKNMKLKGVPGVRVVGPSVVPNYVFPGMQALAAALGAKAGDLILDQYA